MSPTFSSQWDYLCSEEHWLPQSPTPLTSSKQSFNSEQKDLVSEVKDSKVTNSLILAHTLGYNPFKIVREMHSLGGGFRQFYHGFETALIGRLSYLFIRNSIYKIIYDSTKPVKPSNDLTNREKMVIAGFSGGVASLVTSPLALINIRQILDTQIRPEWRRNYTNISQSLQQLGDKKWNGSLAHVLRHVLLNISLTAPFDYFHEGLYLRFGDYGFVRPLAIFLAALVGSAVTLPFDNARTRLMYAHSSQERNKLNYTGIVDLFAKSARYEKSRFALWAGFYSYFSSNLIYAYLTVGVTSGTTTYLKRKNGLKEWQIWWWYNSTGIQ